MCVLHGTGAPYKISSLSHVLSRLCKFSYKGENGHYLSSLLQITRKDLQSLLLPAALHCRIGNHLADLMQESHTDMTKRFQTFKNSQKCKEKQAVCFTQALKNKSEEISLLEAIKGEKEHIGRHILLEKQFTDLELQDRRRDGDYKHFISVVPF